MTGSRVIFVTLELPEGAHSLLLKDVIAPYPILTSHWFTPLPEELTTEERDSIQAKNKKTNKNNEDIQGISRTIFAFCSFGIHGVGAKLRRKLTETISRDNSSVIISLSNSTAQVWRNYMRSSIFCPCPKGDSLSARRLFHAIASGCIPVVIADGLVLPFTQ